MDIHLLSRKGEVQKQLARDVLQLSDCSLYQDVSLLCSDGSLKMNSFLLAAVFPVFRDILGEVSHYDEEMVISLPDVVKLEIKIFLHDLLNKETNFIPGDSLNFLIHNQTQKSSDRTNDIERELKLEKKEFDEVDKASIESDLQEMEDAEVDFSELDPLGDDSNDKEDIVEDMEAEQDSLYIKNQIFKNQPRIKFSSVESDEKDPTKFFFVKDQSVTQKHRRMISGKLTNLEDLDEMIEQLYSKNAEGINYSCHQCSYETWDRYNMKKHVKKHIKGLKELLNLKCTICNKTFSSQAWLIAHSERCQKKAIEERDEYVQEDSDEDEDLRKRRAERDFLKVKLKDGIELDWESIRSSPRDGSSTSN